MTKTLVVAKFERVLDLIDVDRFLPLGSFMEEDTITFSATEKGI